MKKKLAEGLVGKTLPPRSVFGGPSGVKLEEIGAVLLAVLLLASMVPWSILLGPFTGLAVGAQGTRVNLPLQKASVNEQPLAEKLAETLSTEDDGGIQVITGSNETAVLEFSFGRPAESLAPGAATVLYFKFAASPLSKPPVEASASPSPSPTVEPTPEITATPSPPAVQEEAGPQTTTSATATTSASTPPETSSPSSPPPAPIPSASPEATNAPSPQASASPTTPSSTGTTQASGPTKLFFASFISSQSTVFVKKGDGFLEEACYGLEATEAGAVFLCDLTKFVEARQESVTVRIVVSSDLPVITVFDKVYAHALVPKQPSSSPSPTPTVVANSDNQTNEIKPSPPSLPSPSPEVPPAEDDASQAQEGFEKIASVVTAGENTAQLRSLTGSQFQFIAGNKKAGRASVFKKANSARFDLGLQEDVQPQAKNEKKARHTKALIRNIEKLPENWMAQVADVKDAFQAGFSTKGFGVDSKQLKFEYATLTLEKNAPDSPVSGIARCEDFNYAEGRCRGAWEPLGIAFLDLGYAVQFNVTRFSIFTGYFGQPNTTTLINDFANGTHNYTTTEGSTGVHVDIYSNSTFQNNGSGSYYSMVAVLNRSSPAKVEWANWSWYQAATAGNTTGPAYYGPRLSMHFENDTKDSSRYNATGRLGNGSSYTVPALNTSDCKIGSCYTFNGVQTILNTTLMLNPSSTSITLAMWIKILGETTKQQQVAAQDDGGGTARAWLYMAVAGCSSAPQFASFIGASATCTEFQVSANTWYHLVFVSTGTNVTLYVNGTLAVTALKTAASTTGSLLLGHAKGVDDRFTVNGSIDEVHVWDRILSASEISSLYSLENSGKFDHNTTNLTVQVRTKNYLFNDTGLVSWWDLGDEAGSDVNPMNKSPDLAGDSNWLKLGNATNGTAPEPATTNCRIGNCRTFNGLNNFGNTTSKMIVPNTYTITAWFSTSSAGETILSNGNTSLYIDPSGQLSFNYAGTTLLNDTPITAGVMTHAAVTSNSTGVWLYLGGSIINSSGTQGTSLSGHTVIGANATGTSSFWQGELDDVKIWNRSLSANEIRSIYNGDCPSCGDGQERNWTAFSAELPGDTGNVSIGTGVVALGKLMQYKAIFKSGMQGDNYSAFFNGINFSYTSSDTVAPNVTAVNSPANGATVSASATFNVTATDNVDLANVSIFHNATGTWHRNATNSSLSASNIDNPLIVTVSNLPVGNTTRWIAEVCDGNGNCAQYNANRTITISAASDTTAPNVTAVNSPANNLNFSQQAYIFNVTATDDTDLKNLSIFHNATGAWHRNATNSSLAAANNNSQLFVTVSNLPKNAKFVWIAEVCDVAGNCAQYNANRSFVVDLDRPNVTAVTVIPVSPKHANALNCTATVNDSADDFLNLSFTWYKANALNSSYDSFVNNTRNNTLAGTTQNVSQALKSETWICSARAGDEIGWGAYVNSSAVTVGNWGGPSVGTVNRSTAAIDLNPGPGNTTIWCNSTLTDPDNYTDIANATAVFYNVSNAQTAADNFNQQYTNASCALTGGSGNSTTANCTLNIRYYATPGTWNCSINATDKVSVVFANNYTNITVNELIALTVNPSTIDFGNNAPASNSSLASLNVTNQGNIQIDLKADGTNLTKDASTPHINVSQMWFSFTNPFTADSKVVNVSSFNTSYNLLKATGETPSNMTHFYKLEVPTGTASGSYTGVLTLTAQAG